MSHISLIINLMPFYSMATSMHKQIIEDFQGQLFKTCGIWSLVLTAYEGEDHDLKVCMWVIESWLQTHNWCLHLKRDDGGHTAVRDGKDFCKFCPDWRKGMLWDQWIQYGVKCFSKGLPSFTPIIWYTYYVLRSRTEQHSNSYPLKENWSTNLNWCPCRWRTRTPNNHPAFRLQSQDCTVYAQGVLYQTHPWVIHKGIDLNM